MVQFDFKEIMVVPSGEEMINIIMSCTQKQAPTVVDKNYSITRLRWFYMRKVRYTKQIIHDKLTAIIDNFPRLENIHSTNYDLFCVFCNQDHYQLALRKVYAAIILIAKIQKNYIRLLKDGDSLYRCKCLKIAALGHMCTVIKRIGPSLAYLEQVRQYMTMPIDPEVIERLTELERKEGFRFDGEEEMSLNSTEIMRVYDTCGERGIK